jgi:hypothetical protein
MDSGEYDSQIVSDRFTTDLDMETSPH